MREKIEQILKRVFKIDTLPSCPSQANIEAWDSLKHLNLIVELEIEFDMEFTPEQITKMKSLEQIEAVIMEHLKN